MNKETILAKEQVVSEIVEKINRSESVVFIDYTGMTVEEVTALRAKFRAANVEYRVLKNAMLNRAVDTLGLHDVKPHLEGATAVAFSYDDPTSAAKIIMDFIRDAKKSEVKCGIIGNQVYGPATVEALSKIPEKNVLLAQLFSVMNGPAAAFARVVNAIKEQKESA